VAQLEHHGLIRSLRRLGGLGSGYGPAELESSVLPVADLSYLDQPPYHWKRGFMRFASCPATAGVYSHVALYVPDADDWDNLVRVVRWVEVFVDVASYVHLDIGSLNMFGGNPSTGSGALAGICWEQPDPDRSLSHGPAHYGPYTHVQNPNMYGPAKSITVSQTARWWGPFVLKRGGQIEVVQNTPNRYVAGNMYWDDYYIGS